MEYIKLYRAVDYFEKKLIDEDKFLSYDKHIIKPPKDFNTFDYKMKRKHFYFDLASTYFYSKIKYGDNQHIYSFDLPLSLCINNVGAGRYNLGGIDYYILECGIPLLDIIKYTKDYKALIPFFRSYRYFDEYTRLCVKKLININNLFECNENKNVSLSSLDDFESNEFAEKIYKESIKYNYSFNTPSSDIYDYLNSKKLILHK